MLFASSRQKAKASGPLPANWCCRYHRYTGSCATA